MGEFVDFGLYVWMGCMVCNVMMWGELGYFYVYLSYGIYFCINVVCGLEG